MLYIIYFVVFSSSKCGGRYPCLDSGGIPNIILATIDQEILIIFYAKFELNVFNQAIQKSKSLITFPWVAQIEAFSLPQLCMFFGSVTETVGVFWLDCTLLLGPVKFLISKLV